MTSHYSIGAPEHELFGRIIHCDFTILRETAEITALGDEFRRYGRVGPPRMDVTVRSQECHANPTDLLLGPPLETWVPDGAGGAYVGLFQVTEVTHTPTQTVIELRSAGEWRHHHGDAWRIRRRVQQIRAEPDVTDND